MITRSSGFNELLLANIISTDLLSKTFQLVNQELGLSMSYQIL
jgi:hypothetical protein